MHLLQHHWPRWCMTRDLMLRCLRAPTVGLTIAIALFSGCGTTYQPERSIQQVANDASPEARGELPTTEIPSLAEQNPFAAVDEKNSIFFSQGSSALSPSEKDKIQRAASLLKDDKGLSVRLIGRANDNGSRSLNLAVADARVEAVASSLKRLGVKTSQIKKTVIGGEKPPNTCRSAECRQMMRRVEFVFSKTK
jgi:outer membrane protein OmpA-like peptidoglycan-associated protein